MSVQLSGIDQEPRPTRAPKFVLVEESILYQTAANTDVAPHWLDTQAGRHEKPIMRKLTHQVINGGKSAAKARVGGKAVGKVGKQPRIRLNSLC
jgi:hypothetical protein